MTSSADTTTIKRRVAHVGTGMTGSVALRAIIDDPALDLIGVKVSSPTKSAPMPVNCADAPT